MNTDLKKSSKNVQKHRDIMFVTTEKKTTWCQNQIIILQSFSQKPVNHRNEKNSNTHK